MDLAYTLLVLHKTDKSFGYYDVETGRQIALLRTRPFPHEICLSPNRQKVYIAEMGVRGVESKGDGGHTLSVWDVKTREQISSIDTGKYDRPHGIATHANGKLAVTSESTKHLLIYDMATERLQYAVFLDQECAHMVNISPDGQYAYTANVFSNSLSKVNLLNGQHEGNIDVLERPEGMAFSPDGSLIYVVNRESAAISVIDRKLDKQIDTIKTGIGPVRIVISPDGTQLAIPLYHSAAVQIVNTKQRRVTHTGQVGPRPAGAAISPDGKLLFASCEDENKIYVFSIETTNILHTINTGPGCDAMVCLLNSEMQ